MHAIKTTICLTLLVFSFTATAVEPVDDQQLMFYYHIPLGADKQQDAGHQFGLRLDRTTHDPRDTVQIDVLDKRQAMMDFRMGYKGVQSIKLHGVEYASYLVARAAAGEESTDAAPAEETAAESTPVETDAGDETAAEAEEKPAEEESEFAKQLKDLPLGVYVGVLIGIGIIAGVGG